MTSAVRGFHGQIGGHQDEDALGVRHGDRVGDHPDLAAPRIKVGVRPDLRWTRKIGQVAK